MTPIAEQIIRREAAFDAERVYRYSLFREWAKGTGYVAFGGLNPSTADETKEDPTIRREIRFAMSWGFRGLWKFNAFAFRSTDPRALYRATDPVGPQNDDYILEVARNCSLVVVAWGVHGAHMNRGAAVTKLLAQLPVAVKCFGRTACGQPRHPLYLPADAKLEDWRRP